MTEPARPDGVTEFVDAILEGYAPISLALEHMFESPSNPTVEDVRAVLGKLLCDVLEPLAATHGSPALMTAAAVVEDTVPLITENLLFVPHEPLRNRAERRADQRRRGGGRNRRGRP